MKNIMFPLLAVLLFMACQNSTPAPAADTQNSSTELKIDPVKLKEATAKSKTVLQNMNNLMSEIKEAEPTLTEAQKVNLETIRHEVDDIMTKQEMMAKALESAQNGGGAQTGGTMPTPGVIQDYIESTRNYDQPIEDLRAQLQALKSGKSKN